MNPSDPFGQPPQQPDQPQPTGWGPPPTPAQPPEQAGAPQPTGWGPPPGPAAQPGATPPPGWGPPPTAPLPPGVIPAGYQPGGWVGAPPPKRRRRGLLIGLGVFVALIVLGVIGNMLLNADRGKVLFSTTVPEATDCKVPNQVTEIKQGESVYMTAIFKSKMDGSVEFTIKKDGAALGDPFSEDASGYDCLASTENIGTILPAGVYTVTATHEGQTVAEGTLTVKAP